MSVNGHEMQDDTAIEPTEQAIEYINAPKRKLSEIESETKTEDPLDNEIRQLTRNLEELRKRRKLIELQGDVLVEEQLIAAAQQRLQAAREAGSRPPQEYILPTVHVTPKLRENGELTILGSAQTPVKDQVVSREGSPTSGSRPRSKSDGHLVNSNASPYPTNSASRSIQQNRQPATSSDVNPTSSAAAESEAGADSSRPVSQHSDPSTNDVDSSSIAQRQRSPPKSSPPPSRRPSQPPRRMSPQPPPTQSPRPISSSPPEPRVRPCEAKSWRECRNFMGNLEIHFSRYPNHFTRARQLLLAMRYLAPELRDKWVSHCEDLARVTWFDLCVFLANQLASTIPGSTARRMYTTNYQKESQSVTEYAIWLQQFAPHFRSAGHNPMRHLYDRIRPVIKEHMANRNKGYDGFRDMTVFVEYLQSMEDSIPERIEQLSHRKNFPRN